MSWTRKLLPRSPSSLLPRSLRSRLIVSFGILIFLSLFLAGTATVYLLRDQQEKAARERVGLLAAPIGQQAAILEAAGATPSQIEEALEEEYDVRILLVDHNAMVVSDSGNTLAGARISQISADVVPGPKPPRFNVARLHQGRENFLLFTAPPVAIRLPGAGVFTPSYVAVVAVQESDIEQAWRDLLPRLFIAGGIAFLLSVVAAGLLARTITQPLRRITSASEAMAHGQYDQQIPIHGSEEVQRLASAFNEMAQQVGSSHRTLRDFLANVSHELKTPLTSIQGFSQAMVDGSLAKPEDFMEAGRIINDESVRMRGLVDDLLYLSQVEAGEFSMNFDALSPNELMQATRERFQRRAEQAGVDLAVQTGSRIRINADGRRLEQALANIVDNAVRHTPKGGRVTLRSAAENGHIDLSVHNTGSYIAPEDQARIFERFFQADPLGARTDANTGLGLAITHEIVAAHGGSVSVKSSPTDGTEFTITLPVRRPVPSPEIEPES